MVGRAGIRGDVARAQGAFAPPSAPHLSDRRVLLYAFDVLAPLLASLIALELGGAAARPWSWVAIGASLAAWTLVAWGLDCYNVRRAARPRHSIAGVYAALLGTALVLWAVQRLAVGSVVLAAPSPGWIIAAAFFLGAARVACARLLTRAAFQRPVLVIGPEAVGQRLVDLIRTEAPREYRVIVATDVGAVPDTLGSSIPVARSGSPEELTRLLCSVLSSDGRRVALANAGRASFERLLRKDDREATCVMYR